MRAWCDANPAEAEELSFGDVYHELFPEAERAAAKERQESTQFGCVGGGKLPPPSTGKTRDRVAAHVGMSGRTLDQAGPKFDRALFNQAIRQRWQAVCEYVQERAAVREYDGEQGRAEAERGALCDLANTMHETPGLEAVEWHDFAALESQGLWLG